MKIELDLNDIIKEIQDGACTNANDFFEIINRGANNWGVFYETTELLLKELKMNSGLYLEGLKDIIEE